MPVPKAKPHEKVGYAASSIAWWRHCTATFFGLVQVKQTQANSHLLGPRISKGAPQCMANRKSTSSLLYAPVPAVVCVYHALSHYTLSSRTCYCILPAKQSIEQHIFGPHDGVDGFVRCVAEGTDGVAFRSRLGSTFIALRLALDVHSDLRI